MVFEFVRDDSDGTESLVIDSCEVTAWRNGDEPRWVGPVKELMAQRTETGRQAMERQPVLVQ